MYTRVADEVSGEFHLRKPPVIRKPPLVAPRSGTRGGFLITPPEAENFYRVNVSLNSAGGENCYKKAPSYKKAPPCYSQIWNNGGGFLKGRICWSAGLAQEIRISCANFFLEISN